MDRPSADLASMQMAGLADRNEKGLFVHFYNGLKENEGKSKEAGRPIFDEVPFVRIIVAGDKDNIIDRPVWDDPLNRNSDVSRFPGQWAAFRAGKEQAVSGTPLEAWPVLSRAQAAELKHFHVRTVENIADMPDSIAQKFMGIQAIRQKAKDFLEAAKGNAPMVMMREELDKATADKAELNATIAELAARLKYLEEKDTKPERKKAG